MKTGTNERAAIWKKRIEEFRNSGLSRRAGTVKSMIAGDPMHVEGHFFVRNTVFPPEK